MDLKKVFDLFHINPSRYILSKDAQKWKNILRDYYNLKEDEVIQAYEEVCGFVGEERHPFYYLTAVRRRVHDNQHEEFKKAPVPKLIKDIFK